MLRRRLQSTNLVRSKLLLRPGGLAVVVPDDDAAHPLVHSEPALHGGSESKAEVGQWWGVEHPLCTVIDLWLDRRQVLENMRRRQLTALDKAEEDV